ncbi:hypothetical protein PM082_011582 [Marasmius tenuissimus]|nr:hypothetical protein PM082_011582 [Marasmius tenuissimus]
MNCCLGGPDCQKKDWKIVHKTLCGRLKQVNVEERKTRPTHRLSRVEYALKRQLQVQMFSQQTAEQPYGDPWMSSYLYDAEKCEVCFRTRFQTDSPARLSPCSHCRLAWWCSPECGKDFSKFHSKKHCEELQIIASVDRLEVDYAIDRKSFRHLMVRTDEPRTIYMPLSSIKGWSDYCEKVFPEFDYATSFTAQTIKTYHPDPTSAVRLLTMEASCFPLSVIAAMEDVITNISTRNRLCIHVVGAASRDLQGKGMLEELLHFLPKLRVARIFFAGPEAEDHQDTGKNLACERCISKGRSRTCSYYEGTYHDFARTKEALDNRPDLIVGLNTGMSEIQSDSWMKTLRVIQDMDIPALFTAYTKKEGESEIALMTRMGFGIRKGLELNKWKGVVPKTNNYWNTDKDGPIASYNSYYRYIVQGRA